MTMLSSTLRRVLPLQWSSYLELFSDVLVLDFRMHFPQLLYQSCDSIYPLRQRNLKPSVWNVSCRTSGMVDKYSYVMEERHVVKDSDCIMGITGASKECWGPAPVCHFVLYSRTTYLKVLNWRGKQKPVKGINGQSYM